MMTTAQHICRTHGWVSSLTPCQDCLEEPEPNVYVFEDNVHRWSTTDLENMLAWMEFPRRADSLSK
jgi:hypothetical protein